MIRDQEYEIVIPPAPKYVAFSGAGTSISSQKSEILKTNQKIEAPPIASGIPKVKILIRFHDGNKKEVEFSSNSKIEEIYKFVSKVAPVKGNFSLVSGFPPKILDMNKKIESEELNNAIVIQKIE